MPSNRTSWIAAITVLVLGASVLGGCIYLPRTTTIYDDKCRFYRRHMTLEVQQAAVIAGCAGDACIAALALFGVVSAATAIVSGSVVVVGNVVYWLEKQTHCLNSDTVSERSEDGNASPTDR